VNDDDTTAPPDWHDGPFGRAFAQLTPVDQELVMTLVNRLLGIPAEESDYPPDVAFMDFDE
jgi:hypothetical protein